MLIDYLRYTAFSGFLSGFFEGGYRNVADEETVTGLHLRFSPRYIAQFQRDHRRWLHSQVWSGDPQDRWEARLEVLATMGIEVEHDPLFSEPGRTLTYRETGEAHESLEIVVDINPELPGKLPERADSWEGVPVRFRTAPYADGHLASSGKVFDRSMGDEQHGTLCGFICTDTYDGFALTCGHVARVPSLICVEVPRSLWRIPLPPRVAHLGRTIYHAIPDPSDSLTIDAGLIRLEGDPGAMQSSRQRRFFDTAPIAGVWQEELVTFTGAGTRRPRLARVSAVTVKKKIRLPHDGQPREFQDLLMLGAPEYPYFRQPISRPGDSGSAVMSHRTRPTSPLEWKGMLIGGDPVCSYASHAEHVAGWARSVLGASTVDFYGSLNTDSE